jgi:raffinose/stachyose/melibiose transport system substrate-binding protein
MKRRLAALLAACLVLLLLPACGGNKDNNGGSGGSGSDGSGSDGNTTIKFWYSANDADPNDTHYKWMKDTIDQFQAANPNIRVEPTVVANGDQYLNKISTEMAANNAPDIFQTWMSGRLEPFVKADRVYPLNEAINADPAFKGLLNTNNLDTATFDGKIYALPNAMTAEVVFYNKALFDKFKLPVPQTWDELMNVIKTFKDNGIVPFALGNKDPWPGSIPYMGIYDRLNGPKAYEEVVLKQQAKWTDPSFAEAAKKLVELKDAGAFPDNFNGLSYEEAVAMFHSEKAAMFFIGTWIVTEANAKLEDKLGFFNFPDIPGGKGSKEDDFIVNKDEGYAISNASKNKETAIKLLKFVFSKERQSANAEQGQLIPTKNIPYDKSKIPAITNELNDALTKVKNSMLPWDNPLGQNIGKEFNMTTQAILGGADIEDSFKKLQAVSEKAWNK